MALLKIIISRMLPFYAKALITFTFLLIFSSAFSQYLKIWEGYNSQNIKTTFYKINSNEWIEKKSFTSRSYFELDSSNGEYILNESDRVWKTVRLTDNSCYVNGEKKEWDLVFKGKWVENNFNQQNNEHSANAQINNSPTLNFPIEIISHDPKRNFFKDFISPQEIGKNLIINPKNTFDNLIIKQVDTTVLGINSRISLINTKLRSLRSELPNTREGQYRLDVIRLEAKNYYDYIDQYDFYIILDPKKVSRVLRKCDYSGFTDLSRYNIFLYEKGSRYFLQIIDGKTNRNIYSQYFSQENWDKLKRKSLIEKVDDNQKKEFLLANFGTNESQYLNYGLFTNLLQDSIKNSIYKQDIFGYTYIGQVENGFRSGFGTLVNLYQDTIYKGIWKDDMPYQGQFYQFNYENKCFGNCENGIGLKVKNGCVYRGGFKDGKRDGKGEYIFLPNYGKSNNNYMISTFTNGKDGLDRKDYTLNSLKSDNKNTELNKYYNGDLYIKSKQIDEEGYFKVLRIFNSGQIFSGSFNLKEDIKKGVIYFEDGDIFIGSDQISSDKIDGEGILITLNSNGTFNTLMGEFVDGKINGFGTVTYANGKVNDGLFENGNFIKSNAQIEADRIAQIENENRLKIEAQQNEQARREKSIEDFRNLLKMLSSIQPESPTSSKPTSNSQSISGTSNSTKALCYNCNKEFDFRVFNPNGGYSNVKDSKKGYVKCSNCDYGNHWTGSYLHNYKDPILEKCYVGTCKNGWIQCGVCHGTGYEH